MAPDRKTIISFESRKKSYPAFLVLLCYAAMAFIFKDRWKYCAGIVLALALFLGSYGIGKRLSFLLFKTADQTLYFPLGLGTILTLTYAVASFSTTSLFFYAVWSVVALFGIFELPVLNYRIGRSYFWAAPFVLLAFWTALSPPASFDALSNYLGLPHQYLARGKLSILPGNVFSAFPPFSQLLNLLFAGLHLETGIKPFLILIYFQTISILVGLLRWLITEPVMSASDNRSEEYQVDLMYMSRMELLALPMLLLPSAWILIQTLSPELLAALFFCGGVATIVKEFDFLTSRKLLNAAVLLSFAIWTKYSILVYVLLLPLLWLLLSNWRMPRENLKSLATLLGVILLLFSPFLVRNYLATGDPFYPLLAGILNRDGWTVSQAVALERDFLQRGTPGFTEIFLAPFQLAMQPNLYGPAAATGIIPLVSLVLYPFSRRFRTVNRMLLFVLFCFVAWIFLFRRFLEFYAPFLFVFLASYFAFRYLFLRSRKLLIGCWIVCAMVTALFLYLSYGQQFKPILPGESEPEYLNKEVDLFPLAQKLDAQMEGKTLLLGEARIAYFHRSVDAVSPYDRSELLDRLANVNQGDQAVELLRQGHIRFVVFNPSELQNFSETKGIWQFPAGKIAMLSSALQGSARVIAHSGNVTLYEMKDTGW